MSCFVTFCVMLYILQEHKEFLLWIIEQLTMGKEFDDFQVCSYSICDNNMNFYCFVKSDFLVFGFSATDTRPERLPDTFETICHTIYFDEA